MKIFFIGKKGDLFCERAVDFLKKNNKETEFIVGNHGDKIPEELKWWNGNLIISYLSPWILPQQILDRADMARINFHPGPPEYPGIGCTNFAFYNEALEYGVTCHHMAAKVDTGKIIAVERFPILMTDTVYSLTQRCYYHILTMFYKIISDLLNGKSLPVSNEIWTRKPYTRKELNELCRITSDMSETEMKRRIRATSFPDRPGAYIKLYDYIFSCHNNEL